MIVWPEKYKYQVCPFCKSKRIVRVVMIKTRGERKLQFNEGFFDYTGYLCENCNRYHPKYPETYIIDKKEMRRDMNRLKEFLEVKE